MLRLAVIGFGNELRRDDGAGPAVAREVAGWNRPGVRAVAVHQLVPELAELIADADAVVFADAVGGPGGLAEIAPQADTAGLGHSLGPQALLAMAEALYGRRPRAWLAAVPGTDFGFGTELSAAARDGSRRAVGQIAALLETLPP
jgi:hydrogenase maturation protease